MLGLIDAIERFDDEQIFTRLTVKPAGLFNLPELTTLDEAAWCRLRGAWRC